MIILLDYIKKKKKQASLYSQGCSLEHYLWLWKIGKITTVDKGIKSVHSVTEY